MTFFQWYMYGAIYYLGRSVLYYPPNETVWMKVSVTVIVSLAWPMALVLDCCDIYQSHFKVKDDN